ncbi:hypothetical protein V8C35DRAFT_303576 [Trichoderma chlorosporum]
MHLYLFFFPFVSRQARGDGAECQRCTVCNLFGATGRNAGEILSDGVQVQQMYPVPRHATFMTAGEKCSTN